MILSPEQFMPVELNRRQEAADARSAVSRLHRDRCGFAPRGRRKPHRGLVLRLVSTAVGRTAQV